MIAIATRRRKSKMISIMIELRVCERRKSTTMITTAAATTTKNVFTIAPPVHNE